MTLKPVPDRAEVSLDFPDKAYMGAFGRNAKFEVKCRPGDVMLRLLQKEPEKREVEVHLHLGLLADILQELGELLAKDRSCIDDGHRADLLQASAKLAKSIAD